MRVVACAVAAIGALVAAPAASAHARLLATQPAQGVVLPHAPKQVSFTFDETVRSGGSATIEGGKLSGKTALATELQRNGTLLVARLPGALANGDYVVTWRVVSDDGHLETGALAFGVGVGTPPPAAVAEQTTQRNNLLTAGRWIFLAGLLAAAGIAGARLALGRREARLAADALAAALAVAVAGALLELSQVPNALETRFGMVTAAAAGVAAFGALAGVGRLVAAAEAAALVLVVAPPLAGHALAEDRPTWLAFPSDLVHTAAAAVWIGGVVWLGLLAWRRSAALVPSGERFARIATATVVVLALSGVARAGAELEGIGQVWSTSYGKLLVAKSVLFLLLLATAWLSSRRLAGRGLAVEAVLLAAVVAAVAGLGSVTPPRNAAEPLRQTALPAPAVVFGGEAGKLAVGVSAAAKDGKLGVRTTVIDGTGVAANGVDVAVSAGGGSWTTAEACGDGIYCMDGAVPRASPRFRVRVDGHVLAFALPADPRHAQARRIVRAAAAATRRLKSVVIRERLSASPGLSLWTTFRIVAPDRMTYVSTVHENGATRPGGRAIVIGDTRWDKDRPSSPWVKSLLQPLDQPVPDWRTAVDASLLGETADTWRVSFRDPTVPAWFEVTIDRRTSHVLRVHMIAAAHFMLRDWGEFNEPIEIQPPAAR